MNCLTATFCIGLLYIVSAGPVLKLISLKQLPRQMAEIYRPLTVINNIPILDEVWGWYVYTIWKLPVVSIPDAYIE